jgi:LacI family transcriptional regulator/LacI family asc operon transcriptional repressor
MNIYDISKKAGVSIATVSRVMNGSDKVSEKTRKKILDIMKETGYTPNAFARGLTFNTMKTIGLLCADCSDHFLATAISYLEKGFRSNGYDCILCCTGNELATRKNYLKLILSKKVDAVVLIGSTFIESDAKNNQYLIDASEEVPVVCINGFLDSPNIYCTLCDDSDAIFQVTSRLIQDGFQKPLFLYRSASYSGLRKLDGFQRACQKAGIELSEKQVLCYNSSINETRDLLLNYYDNEFSFDSVVAGDDELGVSTIKFAKEKGFSIPDDFSVTGYNNSKTGVCCEPELSTIDNKLEFICTNTVQSVMNLFEGQNVPRKTMVSAEYIKRGTSHF